jgi:hypothetical protein
VLEGSVVMQVKGGKEITLTPGQSFYEGPDDVHTVGRNSTDNSLAQRESSARVALTIRESRANLRQSGPDDFARLEDQSKN